MKNIILWLEDRPETISDMIVICRRNGYEVKIVPTVDLFVQQLEENIDKIQLTIIDIMLFSVIDLENIGISDSSTDGGYQAGIVVIDKLLRPLVEKALKKYFNIPILIVSSRKKYKPDEKRINEIAERGGAWIHYIEKGGLSSITGMIWGKEFEKEILDLKKRVKK